MSRTLLIPHDGSKASGLTSELLASLIPAGTRVVLLHVDDGRSADAAILDGAEARLAACEAAVERREVVAADPAGAILEVAEELRPDLVVMSTHGRTGLERLLRGSVAERVLRRCPVPLLMASPFTRAGAGRLDSILVALDGSDFSEQVLDSAMPIARSASARVTLLHVDWNDPTDSERQAKRRQALRRSDIEGWLAGARDRLADAGLDVSIETVQGNVADELLRAARPDRFDLLAMTTHGRSGASRWLLGSTAENVLRACPIPVLLHRVGSVAPDSSG